jgi:peptidoglycan hydrolase-like protein with peptidoglycan-binding domain
MRPTLATMIAVLTALLVVGSGTASAKTEQRSFPGCPMLSENNSNGPCVTRLQNYLNVVNSAYDLQPDGSFGSDVRIAVLDFQGRNHLGADGIVGSVMADKLQRQYDARLSASSNSNSNSGGQTTTATEVTCTDVNTSNPPSASIPPDLQPNFNCYATGGGMKLLLRNVQPSSP